MRRTTFALTAIVMLLIASATDAADLEARVDRSQLVAGESVNLSLRLRDGTEPPVLDVLTRDFDVLNVSRSMRTSIVNDRMDSSLDWTVTLAPRGTGTFEIPEIRAGDAVSSPITLRVTDRPVASAGEQEVARGAVFLDAELDDSTPYVQSRALLTVRLHADRDLIDGEIHTPVVDGAVVERVGEDRTYQSQIGATPYQVVERQFAIFPQRSGELHVPPVVFDGRVRDDRQNRRRDPFGNFFGSSFFDDFSAGFGGRSSLLEDFFGAGGRPVRTASAAVTLDVKARPENADGQWWLPARNVELIEQWESGEVPVFRVGEPVDRTVAIRATGLSGAQLPALDLPEIEGVKQYGEPAVDDTVMRGDEVVSVKLQRTALIPTRAGSIELPAVELAWWDTQADAARTAILPARSVEVLPGDEELVAAPPAVSPTTPDGISRPTHNQSATNFPHPWRLGAWVGAGLGVLMLLAMACLPRVRRYWTPLQSVRVGRRGPLGGLRRAEAALRRACRRSDRAAAVTALRQVALARWPEATGLGPADWAARLGAPELEPVLEQVQRSVYAETETEWDGAELWRVYRSALRAIRRKRRTREAPLPALYPAR